MIYGQVFSETETERRIGVILRGGDIELNPLQLNTLTWKRNGDRLELTTLAGSKSVSAELLIDGDELIWGPERFRLNKGP